MTIKNNIPLKELNTFGVKASAKYFCEIDSAGDLTLLFDRKEFQKNTILILGSGSNLLFTNDFNGIVIKNNIKGFEVIEDNENEVFVRIGAGEIWHDTVLQAIANDWGGIENLSLIPGTVGAAPMQNIGAYGVEIKQVFEQLEAFHLESGELHTYDKEACQFGYRESIFKNKVKGQYIITAITLRLTKKHVYNTSYGAIIDTISEMGIEELSIKAISDAVIQIRQSKLPDPAVVGNAGSFFKNPTVDKIDYEGLRAEFLNIPGYELPDNKVKVPAGWLIEQCDWKGKRIGNIGVHDKQALVIVNYGEGSGMEIKNLSEQIQKSVSDKFGIELTPEVNFI